MTAAHCRTGRRRSGSAGRRAGSRAARSRRRACGARSGGRARRRRPRWAARRTRSAARRSPSCRRAWPARRRAARAASAGAPRAPRGSPGSGIVTASCGLPATDPAIVPPTDCSAALTWATVAPSAIRTPISPRATRWPAGVVAISDSSWRESASVSRTRARAAPPAPPASSPVPCWSVTDAAGGVPGGVRGDHRDRVRSGGERHLAGEGAAGDRRGLPGACDVRQPALRVARAARSASRAGTSNQVPAAGDSSTRTGASTSGAAAGGAGAGGRNRRRRDRRQRRRRVRPQAPRSRPLQRLELLALLLHEGATRLGGAVRAEERPPARRHPPLELLQPLRLGLAGLRLRGDGLACRARIRDSRRGEREKESKSQRAASAVFTLRHYPVRSALADGVGSAWRARCSSATRKSTPRPSAQSAASAAT